MSPLLQGVLIGSVVGLAFLGIGAIGFILYVVWTHDRRRPK